MYDSDEIDAIPASASMVGYYVDGYAAISESAVRSRFPTAILVPISAVGTNAGIVLDVEAGNLNAFQSVDWVLLRRSSGIDPTIYCGNGTPGYRWSDILNAFDARSVDRPWIWFASYDNIQSIPDGAIAKQYADSGMLGIHADASVVADYWPGVDLGNVVIEQECMNVVKFRSNGQPACAAANSEGYVYVVWRSNDGVWHTANGENPVGQIDVRLGIDVDSDNSSETLVYGYWKDKLYCMYSNADWSKWTSIVV